MRALMVRPYDSELLREWMETASDEDILEEVAAILAASNQGMREALCIGLELVKSVWEDRLNKDK